MNSFKYILLVLILVLAAQSCSIYGLGIGALKDISDKKKYGDGFILDTTTWIQPDLRNHKLLIDYRGQTLQGEYVKTVTVERAGDTIDLIQFMSSKGSISHLDPNYIERTQIYRKDPKSALTGFGIGAAIDLIMFIIIIHDDDFFNL